MQAGLTAVLSTAGAPDPPVLEVGYSWTFQLSGPGMVVLVGSPLLRLFGVQLSRALSYQRISRDSAAGRSVWLAV